MKQKFLSSLMAAIVSRATLGMSTVLVPMAALAAPADVAAEAGPQEAMVAISKRLFEALDANRAALRRNPEAVNALVGEILLPRFDVDYAAQLVLARHWNEASEEQRAHFIRAFYGALLHTYGAALADATADRLKVLPFRGDPSAAQVVVRTEVTRSTGAVVPVDYRLRRTADGWKAFDVVIEGISYVRNYRTDLDAEISARGLEATITRIETKGLNPSGERGAGR